MKLHDIENSVAKGVENVARLGVNFLTVHAYPQTMKAAVAARDGSDLKILAVTVLTSYDDIDLAESGYSRASTRWSRAARSRRTISASMGSCARPRKPRRCASWSATTWCS